MTAVRSEAISKIREGVPEFENTFQEELRDEDGELDPFHAMSLFAQWVGETVHERGPDDVARRAFAAVEDLIVDRRIELGDDLAAEFIGVLWNDPAAYELMGPRTRERASPRG